MGYFEGFAVTFNKIFEERVTTEYPVVKRPKAERLQRFERRARPAAQEALVLIAGVVQPRDRGAAANLPEIRTAKAEQRPDDAQWRLLLPALGHARQPVDAGTAREAHEKGLRDVVQCVSESQRRRADPAAPVRQPGEFLLRALGIVTLHLDRVAGFAPGLEQFRQVEPRQPRTAGADVQRPAFGRFTDVGQQRTNALVAADGAHLFHVVHANLEDGAEFFAEQSAGKALGGQVEIQVQSAARCKCHLAHGGQETAVGAVVIGQQETVAAHSLHGPEKARQVIGIFEVGDLFAELAEHLGQRRSCQPVASGAEVEQQQSARAVRHVQLRRQCAPGVRDRCERGDHQRHRRDHAAFVPRVIPHGLEG